MFDTGSRSQILPSLVLGFHGSDEETAEQVLAGKAHLEDTTNDYDRLGHGIYFRVVQPAAGLRVRAQEEAARRNRLGRRHPHGAHHPRAIHGTAIATLRHRAWRLLGRQGAVSEAGFKEKTRCSSACGIRIASRVASARSGVDLISHRIQPASAVMVGRGCQMPSDR